MANINSKWTRWMAIGCTHGHLVDQRAFGRVMDFVQAWKPKIRLHLGDVIDTAAFRSGARGSKDECEPVGPDRNAARDLLLAYEPTVITWGNHDWRLWELADHPNAIVAHAASGLRDDMQNIARKLKAETRDYHIERGWWNLSDDTLAGHGYMYSQIAIKDHARKFGRCLIAHLHRTGQEAADRYSQRGLHQTCTSVGYLADGERMGYAHRRPAYLQWNKGFAYGETNGKTAVIWLAEGPRTMEEEWRLPI